MSKSVKYPKVVLVGRTNVGKSALFNRIVGNAKSIVFERAGVTRDHLSEIVTWDKKPFELIDTGGYSFDKKAEDPFAKLINEKISALIDEADILIFVCDIKSGLTTEDERIAKILHKKKKPIILAINKIDNTKIYEDNFSGFYSLGFGEFIGVSAEHGTGIIDLLDAVTSELQVDEYEKEDPDYSVVLIGRPNVGKSSLMNLILKKERSIISDIPGTTREALSERVNFASSSVDLVDTAGIRRRGRIDDKLETLMVKNAFSSMRDSDIAILVIDSSEKKFAHQELTLLSYAYENKKCLLIVFNKKDLVKEEWEKEQLKFNTARYDFLLAKFPQVNISCKDKKGIEKVLRAVQKIWERCNQTFDEEKLAEVVKEKFASTPMYKSNHRLKLHGIRQLKAKVPTFLLYVNNAILFGDSQLGFIENILRKNYDLKGCPIKFVLKTV